MLNTVFKHGLFIVVLCPSGQGKCLPCRCLGFESRRCLFYTFESKCFFLALLKNVLGVLSVTPRSTWIMYVTSFCKKDGIVYNPQMI